MKLSKKNKYLILGVLVMLFLCYSFAIQNTLTEKERYTLNLSKKEAISNLPEQLSVLGQKEKAIDFQLASMNIGSSSAQNNLLKFISAETTKNKVKIIDFNSPHVIESDQGTIENFIVQLEGDYTSILKTLNALENKGSFGAISHLDFEKKKNYRSKRTYLQAKVFIEQKK